MMDFVRTVTLIAAKDLAIEARSKEIFSSMALFALITLLMINFAIDMTSIEVENIASGALWISFIFASSSVMNRSFAREVDSGALRALLIAPIDRAAIFFGKALAAIALTFGFMALLVPIFIALFNINIMARPALQIGSFALGGFGFALINLLVSAICVNLRAREMMGPLLALPLLCPVLISAVKISAGAIIGARMGDLSIWFKILIVFDLIYGALAALLFEYIIEE